MRGLATKLGQLHGWIGGENAALLFALLLLFHSTRLSTRTNSRNNR